MKKFIIPILLSILLINTLSAQEVILKKGKYIVRATGKPYTGIFKETNASDSLTSETSIKDGLLDGTTTIYYLSGNKKELRNYQQGLKHGTWTTWSKSGTKTAEANFKNGKKDGFWYVWDDQGVKRYEMFYAGGEKKGTWTIWDAAGQITSREEFK